MWPPTFNVLLHEVTMGIKRWMPPPELTEQEEHMLARMNRTGKLFAFLRRHRHQLIDDALQEELETMYRQTGAGKEPVSPGVMAMATILQGYMRASDATMVELTVFDMRVQMVLGCLGSTEPMFSQGALCEFRQRLMHNNMDRRLLEKTVEVAMRQRELNPRNLKSMLRVAIDSRPLEGAGRVEDTFNLLGHAARKIVACAADLLGWRKDKVCREAGIPLLLGKSVKRALDVDWSESGQKARALQRLVKELDSMLAWLKAELPEHMDILPLSRHIKTLEQIRRQDLEPDPGGGGGVRIRKVVAEDRRVSIEDPEMRHGRKSKSKRFNGYKQHVATDLDKNLILACAVTPANRPEAEATPAIEKDIQHQGMRIGELHIDRGYIASAMVQSVIKQQGKVLCKPWNPQNGDLFPKSVFKLNMRSRTIICPAGQTQRFMPGRTVEFEAATCDICPLRAKCTEAKLGHGRTVAISDEEALQQRLRKLVGTAAGRQRLRERVGVEHQQAHLASRQGRRARYRGVRKNVFELRRTACIRNLESWQRHSESFPAMVG